MKRLLIILLFCVVWTSFPAVARRTVTPVGTEETSRPNLADSLPGNLWVDSVAAAQPKVIGNIYPLWDAVQVSVDVWPAVNRAFRSGHGIAGIGAQLSIHNRYFPSIEAGLSSARKTPDGMNFSFRSPLSTYFKIGMDYNFMYNSNPDYKIFAIVRYGLATFDYRFTDVTLGSSYWDTSEAIDFPWRHSTTGYVEVGAGLQVKLIGPLSAGWSFRYHRVVHHSAQPNGSPWAIPGYGATSGSLGITLSLTYTIPLHELIVSNNDEKNKKK